MRRSRTTRPAVTAALAAAVLGAWTDGAAAAVRRPALSIGDARVAEGDTGTSILRFTLRLSRPAPRAVSVRWRTLGAEARGEDFRQARGRVVFRRGTTRRRVRVIVLGDDVDEPDERVAVQLSAPVGARVVHGRAFGTIVDDDPTPIVSIGAASVPEGGTSPQVLKFAVTLDRPASRTVQVRWRTLGGTARARDFRGRYAILRLRRGATGAVLEVPVRDDLVDEPDETLSVVLDRPQGLLIGTGAAVGTIFDDDGSPAPSVSDAATLEGSAGTRRVSFTVSLLSPSAIRLQFRFGTVDGTARSPADYVARRGVVTFAPGETTRTVTVAVRGDTAREGPESFRLELASTTNPGAPRASGTATILDDD